MADNTVNLPFKDNDEFRDYIGRKEVGDTCRITVDFQITDIGDENVSGVISKPEAMEHGQMEHEQPEAESENSPVMMVIAKGGKSKSRY